MLVAATACDALAIHSRHHVCAHAHCCSTYAIATFVAFAQFHVGCCFVRVAGSGIIEWEEFLMAMSALGKGSREMRCVPGTWCCDVQKCHHRRARRSHAAIHHEMQPPSLFLLNYAPSKSHGHPPSPPSPPTVLRLSPFQLHVPCRFACHRHLQHRVLVQGLRYQRHRNSHARQAVRVLRQQPAHERCHGEQERLWWRYQWQWW